MLKIIYHKFYSVLFFILILLLCNNLILAKILDIFPTMSRLEIQQIFDTSSDHDKILFHSGEYDWSEMPLHGRAENDGAIKIIDKTLKIIGESNVILIGPDSMNSTSTEARGVNAFYIQDLDYNNDILFDNLIIKNFLRGICSFYNPDINQYPDEFISNCRNLTVQNCNFVDIHRSGISTSGVKGNIFIRNNYICGEKYGILLDWYWIQNHSDWQPKRSNIKIFNNEILHSGDFQYSIGIIVMNSNHPIIKGNFIKDRFYGIYIRGLLKKGNFTHNSLLNSYYGIMIEGMYWYETLLGSNNININKNQFLNTGFIGISLYGDECCNNIIENNNIEMSENSFAGIYTEAHDNYYFYNSISGLGKYSLYLTKNDYTAHGGIFAYAHNEVFEFTNVENFIPDYSHFYLDHGTYNNSICNTIPVSFTYLDYGTNNNICTGDLNNLIFKQNGTRHIENQLRINDKEL